MFTDLTVNNSSPPIQNNYFLDEKILPLPVELTLNILSLLSAKDLANSTLVSRDWKTLIDTNFQIHIVNQYYWAVSKKKLKDEPSITEKKNDLKIEQSNPIKEILIKSIARNDRYFLDCVILLTPTNFENGFKCALQIENDDEYYLAIDELTKHAYNSKEKLNRLLNNLFKLNRDITKSTKPFIHITRQIFLLSSDKQKLIFLKNLQERLHISNTTLLFFLGYNFLKDFPCLFKEHKEAISRMFDFTRSEVTNSFELFLNQCCFLIKPHFLKEILQLLEIATFNDNDQEKIILHLTTNISSHEDAISTLNYANTRCSSGKFSKLLLNENIVRHLHSQALFQFMQGSILTDENLEIYCTFIRSKINTYEELEKFLIILFENCSPSMPLSNQWNILLQEITKKEFLQFDLFKLLEKNMPIDCDLSVKFIIYKRIVSNCTTAQALVITRELIKIATIHNKHMHYLLKIEELCLLLEANEFEAAKSIRKELCENFEQSAPLEIQKSIIMNLKDIVDRNTEYAENIARTFLNGSFLCNALVLIANKLKQSNQDFLALVFEVRSRALSLSNEEPYLTVQILQDCLKLQFEVIKNTDCTAIYFLDCQN